MEFELYVRQHRASLLRFAVVLTNDPDLASDIVQDALIKAFDRWARIGQLDHIHAYLRRMVVNGFISHQRKWSRSVPTDLDRLDSVVPDPTDLYGERQAMLQQLDRLPPRQRAAIVLRYFEDMSDRDIADVLNCRPTTVRGYVHRALATLRVHTDSLRSCQPVQE